LASSRSASACAPSFTATTSPSCARARTTRARRRRATGCGGSPSRSPARRPASFRRSTRWLRWGAPHGEVVLVAVGSEEDGGLGTFAALERDARFDACLIPEPTGFDVVCTQAGALTFEGVVEGVAAHAAHRLEGVSALDRHIAVHGALAEHERALNEAIVRVVWACSAAA
jgi:hypothetical protein